MIVTDILNNISDAVLIVNTVGEIIFCNEEIESVFEYTSKELIGQNISLLIPDKHKHQHSGQINSYFSNPTKRKMGKETGRPIQGRKKSGTFASIEVSLSHMTIENQPVVMAIIVDVTSKINERNKLEETKAVYASIVENTTDHVFRVNRQGVIEYINHVAPGLTRESVIGSKLIDLQPDNKTKKMVLEVLSKTFLEGKQQTYDTSYPSPLGNIYYSTVISPIIENGVVKGASLVSRDQTNEVEVRKKLIEKQQFIDKIHDNSLNGIYIYHLELGKNTYLNSRYTEILGYSLEEINSLSGAEFFNLFHPDDQSSITEHMNNVRNLKEGENTEIEYRFRNKEGKWVWCFSRDVGFEYDKEGKVISFIGAFVDITKQKEAELFLLNKNQELENFVTIASHDLKSPLNSVSRLFELLFREKEVQENKNLRETIEISHKSITRMQSLVCSLLEHAKIGTTKINEEIDINELLKDVLTDLESIIKNRNAEIIYDKKARVINGNPTEIRQVFQNLISNGIKFNQSEKPIIEILYQDHFQHHLFKIKDNGIGIEETYRKRIFKIFERLHSQSDYVGAGIGLANCKKIVENHQGNIWVNSTAGEGSVFEFTIIKK